MVEESQTVLQLPVKTVLSANDRVLVIANTELGGNVATIQVGKLIGGYTGSIGPGATGYTGSQGDIGYTGSQGDIGYTGSTAVTVGYTGSFEANGAVVYVEDGLITDVV